MSKTPLACLLGNHHQGPCHLYMWNANSIGARYSRLVGRRGVLCEECARSVGAFRLREKKEETKNEQ